MIPCPNMEILKGILRSMSKRLENRKTEIMASNKYQQVGRNRKMEKVGVSLRLKLMYFI